MEVLHDLRPKRRLTGPSAPGSAGIARAALLFVLLGCTHEPKRDLETPDTAVAMSAAGSTGGAGGGVPDSTSVAAPGQTSRDTLLASVAQTRTETMRLVVNVTDSAAGDVLYRGAGTCQTCHGTRGEGVAGLGPSLNDSLWLHGDGSLSFIQRVTLDGLAVPRQSPRGMPAFASRLSAGDAYKVAAYVYTLSHPHVTVTHPFGSVPVSAPGSPP